MFVALGGSSFSASYQPFCSASSDEAHLCRVSAPSSHSTSMARAQSLSADSMRSRTGGPVPSIAILDREGALVVEVAKGGSAGAPSERSTSLPESPACAPGGPGSGGPSPGRPPCSADEGQGTSAAALSSCASRLSSSAGEGSAHASGGPGSGDLSGGEDSCSAAGRGVSAAVVPSSAAGLSCCGSWSASKGSGCTGKQWGCASCSAAPAVGPSGLSAQPGPASCAMPAGSAGWEVSTKVSC
mmetsp:Transcript_52997/g.149321  ORF Transcript_52997/g.149321 Transcript_52997/m.149321 type:complete len:242 (+) Transcript_52997:544-1269(+)